MQSPRMMSAAAMAAVFMILGGTAAAQPAQPGATPPAPEAAPQDTDAAGDPASEPTADDIEKARQAFVDGNAFFQAKDYENAVNKFKEAYRLSRNPLLLYNIGFTHDLKKDRDLALFYYEKFLKDVGPKAQVYDEVKARVEAIKKAREASSAFDTGSMGKIVEEEASMARITEFMHKVVEETPPRLPLDLTAFVPDGSGWQVTLYYRAAGEDRFEGTLMRPRYNELVGRIPASKTHGKTLQYYLEVRDKTGKIVERSGRAASPNLVFVDPDAQPRYYADLEPQTTFQDKPKPGEATAGLGTQPGPGEDAPRGRKLDTYDYARWGTTGLTVGMVTAWLTLRYSASNMAYSLEDEAQRSRRQDDCVSGPPCRSFSSFQKDLQSLGERYELFGNISLGVGVLSAGVAGYLWYRELAGGRGGEPVRQPGAAASTGVKAFPIVGRDVLGGAALITF